jgi:ribosome-associated toxin RatA of RatAB toxin-antitoxin module
MKHVRKSVLLWYSPREMYDLVTGIAAYPQFLPWCSSAEVLEQHADG